MKQISYACGQDTARACTAYSYGVFAIFDYMHHGIDAATGGRGHCHDHTNLLITQHLDNIKP